ncbi:MFS transporter [Saccharothrix sp. HUAS TT1]|uniref:MFS transporter n=1 Tax=unclassified Saccharothrix TaxID=2593673 RepID=UPI00345BC50B
MGRRSPAGAVPVEPTPTGSTGTGPTGPALAGPEPAGAARVRPRTYALAGATVAAGTSGYLVAAVLPELAAGLEVSVPQAGQTITAFALAYAVSAPLLAVATGGWERRTLLVAALIVTAAGNLGAAAADGFGWLLAARVVTALGAALTTPAATALAAETNPPGARGRAMAVVTAGLTAATVLGVPAGRLVTDLAGDYRAAFLLAAGLCGAAGVLVALAAPAVPAGPAAGLRRRLGVLRDRSTRRLLAVSLLACLGTFAAYGYLAVLVAGGGRVDAAVVLLGFGAGGVVGNVLGGRAADRWGSRTPLLVVLAGCAALLAVLAPAVAAGTGPAVAVAVVWGGLFWAFNPPLFAGLVAVDPAQAGMRLALNASAIYLGIAGAGAVGGAVADLAGVELVPPVAAVLTAAALVVAALVRPRPPRPERARSKAAGRPVPLLPG